MSIGLKPLLLKTYETIIPILVQSLVGSGGKKAKFTMVVFDLQKELHIQGDMLKRQLKRTLKHTNFLGVIVLKKFQGSKEKK